MKSRKKLLGIQRRMGLVMLVMSIIVAAIIRGDVTYLLVTIPLGLGLLLTKEVILYHEEK